MVTLVEGESMGGAVMMIMSQFRNDVLIKIETRAIIDPSTGDDILAIQPANTSRGPLSWLLQ